MSGLGCVVAAVDFTGDGLEGARWAARHLAPERLVLLHSVHLPEPPGFLKGLFGDEEQVALSAQAGARARLEEFARQLERETSVPVEARIRTGEPAEQIAAVAGAVDAELVVIGPHARCKGRWHPLGSTAERVIHDARVPTLLTTGGLRQPERILAAVDDSAVAAGLLEWLGRLVAITGAEATVVHVIDTSLEMTYRAILAPRAPGRETELERKGTAWLEGRLREAGFEDEVTARVVLGEPGLEILVASERFQADLILMGTHGAGAATRFLAGGVARMVMRGARCPVLLLPTPA